MRNYLISGLPGTGKTTIQTELKKLGYETINSDEDWGYYGNLTSGEAVIRPEQPSQEWFKDNGFIWNVENVQKLLSSSRSVPLFVCGGSRNEEKFYDLFDAIFVLHIPDEVMIERLSARNVPFMKSEDFLARMLLYNQQDIREHAKLINGVVIDGTQPVASVLKQILGECHL